MAELPKGYIRIAGDYSYAKLNMGGMVIRNPAGVEVFFQPGEEQSVMYENFEALDEIEGDAKRATIADMILGDYFA